MGVEPEVRYDISVTFTRYCHLGTEGTYADSRFQNDSAGVET